MFGRSHLRQSITDGIKFQRFMNINERTKLSMTKNFEHPYPDHLGENEQENETRYTMENTEKKGKGRN